MRPPPATDRTTSRPWSRRRGRPRGRDRRGAGPRANRLRGVAETAAGGDTVIALLLLAAAPALDAHWNAVLACPRVTSGSATGTGVVIGVKDGSAYLLTA